jgi:hypothetical protein
VNEQTTSAIQRVVKELDGFVRSTERVWGMTKEQRELPFSAQIVRYGDQAPNELAIDHLHVAEQLRGNGVLGAVLSSLESNPLVGQICFANVRNERLHAYLVRRGYHADYQHLRRLSESSAAERATGSWLRALLKRMSSI